jgi:hypothetical protein
VHAARFFDVVDILCGDESQLVEPANVNAIPGVIFAAEAPYGFRFWCDVGPLVPVRMVVRRNARKRQSWAVRLVRRWLGFEADPPVVFAAALICEVLA